MARKFTNQLLEMVEEGLLDKDTVIMACVKYMSEDDVADMMHANEFIMEDEDEDEDENPFHVVGIDENDGSATILEQFDNSGSAREWMNRYVQKENAGNWKHIEVLDTRDECAETLWRWELADAE